MFYVGEENKLIATQREEDFSNGRKVDSDSCAVVAAHNPEHPPLANMPFPRVMCAGELR